MHHAGLGISRIGMGRKVPHRVTRVMLLTTKDVLLHGRLYTTAQG